MDNFFNLFGNNNDKNNKNKDQSSKNQRDDSGTMTLHKEELDINKSRVQMGDVELGKEIIEEQKSVDVPVTHEEVVIERKSLNNEDSKCPIKDEETIRIPVSEEQVNVGKHTVATEEITARKRNIEETKHIDETLKREEASINKNGDANIIEDKDSNFS